MTMIGLWLTPSRCQCCAKRRRRSSASVFVGCLSLSLIGVAVADSDIALSGVSPRFVVLAQGEEAEFVVRVSNNGPDPIEAVTVATPVPSIFADWYPLTMPVQAGCEGLFPGFPFHPSGMLSGYHFSVGPLPVGQHQDCRFSVQRALGTTSDGGYGWQTSGENDPVAANNATGFVFGSLTDVGIRVDPVSFALDSAGFAEGVVRLTAENHGPSAVREFQIGACTDNYFPEFQIDADFAQGCGSAQYGPICFDRGFGFLRPELAAGQSHSCLIRLRGRSPYSVPLSFPIDLQTYTLVRADFGALADIDSSNDASNLRLGPVPTTSVDSLSWFGRWLLITMLVLVAVGRGRAWGTDR